MQPRGKGRLKYSAKCALVKTPRRFNKIARSPQEYGKCGDLCYIIDGEKKLVLKEGKEYRNPDRPCDVYRCTVSSTDIFRLSVRLLLSYRARKWNGLI